MIFTRGSIKMNSGLYYYRADNSEASDLVRPIGEGGYCRAREPESLQCDIICFAGSDETARNARSQPLRACDKGIPQLTPASILREVNERRPCLFFKTVER